MRPKTTCNKESSCMFDSSICHLVLVLLPPPVVEGVYGRVVMDVKMKPKALDNRRNSFPQRINPQEIL